MNSPLTQGGKSAKLKTPFGKDVLVLTQFDGTEALGELFEFRIQALSEQEDLDFDKAIGRSCSVTYEVYGNERVFNGILVEAEWVGSKDYYNGYRLVLRPWLWLLSQTTNCEFFEDMTASDIIKKIFSDHGFTDFEDRLTENYPKLEYCVQYRETDLAFVSRLMEQHGIYYYFEHSSDKHMLVLADSKSCHKPAPKLASIPFLEHGVAGGEGRQHVADWAKRRHFRTGKVEYNDYDHQQPSAKLLSNAKGSERYNKSDLETYDYPGKYKKRSDGEKYAKVLLESEQADDQRRHANGAAPSLFAGARVSLEKHPKGSENKEYIVVRATHSISDHSFRSQVERGPGESYAGYYEFTDRAFRSPVVTPEPLINGIQTAIVVGPQGEEIHTDECGRIKVQFHWDRDKKPSCWVRVAQVWSGKKWGGQYIPRIGMEVVVEFLEGNPDRPLVIGTVYNAEYMPPYPLPANKTQSGLKSNSSKGGSGYNEFQFEDKKGSEKIRMHAEKDLEVEVVHDESRKVGAARSTTIGSDDSLDVGAGQSITVGKSQTVMIGKSQTITIADSQTVTAGRSITLRTLTQMTLMVGASMVVIKPDSVNIIAPNVKIIGAGGVVIKGAMGSMAL